jgi:hypothetical protein
VGALCAALAALATRGACSVPMAQLRAADAQPLAAALASLLAKNAAAAVEARAAGALASCFAALQDCARGGHESGCASACLVIAHICAHASAASAGFRAAAMPELGAPGVARAMRAALAAPTLMAAHSSAAALSSFLHALLLGRAAPPGTRAALLADGGAGALAAALRAATLGLQAEADASDSAGAAAGAGAGDDGMMRVCATLLLSVGHLCAADGDADADALDAATSDDALSRLGSERRCGRAHASAAGWAQWVR